MFKFEDFEEYEVSNSELIKGGYIVVCWGNNGDSCTTNNQVAHSPSTTCITVYGWTCADFMA